MADKNGFVGLVIIIVVTIFLFLAFLNSPLQGEVPEEMKTTANELKEKSMTKMELARETYNLVDDKYNSTIREYIRQPKKVFLKDREEIWNLEMEYIPSNTQNSIYQELLILTGEFNEDDFTIVQSTCTHTPHWYIILDVDGEEIFVDLWMADNSILNDTFGCFTNHPCNPDSFICGEGFS